MIVWNSMLGAGSLRILRSLILAIGTLFLIAACEPQRSSPLQLGTNVWPGYEPLYLARSLQLLDEDQIRLVEFVSASEVMRQFRNHHLDIAALTLDEAIILLDAGQEIEIIMVLDVSDGGDVILGRAGTRSMAALTGKRIGVENTALGAYTLSRALEIRGMSLEDIIPVALEVNEHFDAFMAGEVDAVVTFDPVRTRLLAQGAVELFSSREIPGEIVDVLVARKGIAGSHPEALQHVADAWFGALDYLQQNPESAASLMQGRLKLAPAEILATYNQLQLPDRAGNRSLLVGEAPALLQTAARLSEVMIADQLIKESVDVRALFGGHD
ncbi:MAG: ABC transporter substrate-binding protein [Pseudomonadales bacterium]|nr:ABC transporter substrate-binding protein [Pseudomonadales bacterium]